MEIPRPAFNHWDAARIFLEVIRSGSFRAAEAALGLSANSISARIDELEQALGLKVLVRGVGGVELTSEGQHLLAAIEEMEHASLNLLVAREQASAPLAGEVRLVVSEGLGTFWVTPRLVQFQRANPDITVNLEGVVHTVNVGRLEADAVLQLHHPTMPDARIKKVGRLHLYPFVAPSYAEVYGLPTSLSELRNHRIVIQADTDADLRAVYDRIIGNKGPVFRTNVGSAHYWALAQGCGIGVLPTYAFALGAPLIPLDIGLRKTLDIWLAFHPDMRATPRVGRLIDWLTASFDPRKFPWFRDEFVHPRELEKAYEGEPIAKLFSGFFGR